MFELAWPALLFALPLPLSMLWLPPLPASPAGAIRVPFAGRCDVASVTGSEAAPRVRLLGLWLVWCLLVLAACRPQWVGEAQSLTVTGRDLMLAVDISGSMEEEDMEIGGRAVQRLDAVKALLGEFIARRQGDRLGLVLFGAAAYVQAPLTHDLSTVRTLLDEAQLGFAGNGTAIGDAIGLGIKKLQSRPASGRVMVLLTDGANNAGSVAPEQAARLAKQAGVRVYTIGLGAEPGVFSRLLRRNADLNEPLLQFIASTTGGTYFRARDAGELASIYQALDRLEPIDYERNQVRPVTEWFHLPLGLAVLVASLMGAAALGPIGRRLKHG